VRIVVRRAMLLMSCPFGLSFCFGRAFISVNGARLNEVQCLTVRMQGKTILSGFPVSF
jgi:hypothetical protein